MSKRSVLTNSTYVSFCNSQGLNAQGTLVKLSRQSVVFEVYNPYSIVQLSEVLTELRIHRGEYETYKGRAVITGLLNTGLMLIVSASLVDPWSDLKGLEPGAVLRKFVRDFVDDWQDANARLETSFQISVTNLRNYLQEVRRWLEHWEMEAGIDNAIPLDDRNQQFVSDVDSQVAPRLTELYERFEESAQQVNRKDISYHRAFAQRDLHPMMMCAPFMHRAFNKPLGYAGDYEMVRMMLGDPWEGANTFGKILNASALRHEAPAAHRNRVEMLQSALERETHRVLSGQHAKVAVSDAGGDQHDGANRRVKILNIGCGPAVEIRNFASADSASEMVDFHLVDFNAETLEHVRDSLIPHAQSVRPEMRIETEQRSVHEIIQLSVEGGQPSQREPRYDVVYCAGLFDYFRDTTCGYLIELFYSWVKEGGLVLVTNVTPAHSSVAIMGMVLDWNLELRDEKKMLSLVPQLGEQTTYCDRTGVNVFLEIRKPVP